MKEREEAELFEQQLRSAVEEGKGLPEREDSLDQTAEMLIKASSEVEASGEERVWAKLLPLLDEKNQTRWQRLSSWLGLEVPGSWSHSLLRYAVITFAFGFALGGANYATARSVPGDPLYSTKKTLEKAAKTFSITAMMKANTLLEHAARRIDEIQSLAALGETDDIGELVEEAEEDLAKTEELLPKLDPDERERVEQRIQELRLQLEALKKQQSPEENENEQESSLEDDGPQGGEDEESIRKEDSSERLEPQEEEDHRERRNTKNEEEQESEREAPSPSEDEQPTENEEPEAEMPEEETESQDPEQEEPEAVEDSEDQNEEPENLKKDEDHSDESNEEEDRQRNEKQQ